MDGLVGDWFLEAIAPISSHVPCACAAGAVSMRATRSAAAHVCRVYVARPVLLDVCDQTWEYLATTRCVWERAHVPVASVLEHNRVS